MAKIFDSGYNTLKKHFAAYVEGLMGLGLFQPADWQAVVKRIVVELENFIADEPKLPQLLCSGLVIPLMDQGSLKMDQLEWYKEGEPTDTPCREKAASHPTKIISQCRWKCQNAIFLRPHRPQQAL